MDGRVRVPQSVPLRGVMASASAGELVASMTLRSFAQPGAIEDAISRCAEGTSGLRVPLEIAFVIVVRGSVTPATLSEVPPQLVGGRWAKRIRKLLLPCPLVRGPGFAKVARDPQAQRPTTERSEQFGMAQEERSEVHGRGTRDEVAEDVLASLVNDADGELVGKEADASFGHRCRR